MGQSDTPHLSGRRDPTHVLRIEVPLNLDGNPAAEKWDIDGAFQQAMGAILPMLRVGTLGLLCDEVTVTMVELGGA